MTKINLLVVLLAVSTANCVGIDGPQDDAKFVSDCILQTDANKGSNYQILLRNLYHALDRRYKGMEISEFDRLAGAWGWKRLNKIPERDSGYVNYDMRAVGYLPSPGYPHDLYIKVFVSGKLIMSAGPYILIHPRISYKQLLDIGYPPRSVLGRFVRLDSLRRKVERAGRIDSISLEYHDFRYASSITEAYVFCVEIVLPSAGGQESDHFYYYVTSGLDYVSLMGEPQPAAFKGTNVLIESPFVWNTLIEKDGERVFHCPADDR